MARYYELELTRLDGDLASGARNSSRSSSEAVRRDLGSMPMQRAMNRADMGDSVAGTDGAVSLLAIWNRVARLFENSGHGCCPVATISISISKYH